MINELLMRTMRMSFIIILVTFSLVLIPSFAVNSLSQSDNSVSNSSMSNASTSDESSFASLSRSLAETNQTDKEPTPPPPPSRSGVEDKGNGGPSN